MRNDLDKETIRKLKHSKYARNLLIATPFYVLTLGLFILLASILHFTLDAKFIALGVVGWWASLMLRFPLIILIRKIFSKENQARNATVSLSGPVEEIVRLAILLLIGLTTSNAFSVGIGWAGIEIIYSIIQGFVTAALHESTSKKAKKVKALMKRQGMEKTMTPTAPYYGIIERFSANALHIGFGLLLVFSPYIVILTMIIHSLTNLVVLKLAKKSLLKAELAVLVIALVVFIGGFIL